MKKKSLHTINRKLKKIETKKEKKSKRIIKEVT